MGYARLPASVCMIYPNCPALAARPATRRFLVIDGSSIQGPGATGTHDRLHLCLDLVTLALTPWLITDTHTGDSLQHWRWAPGDVAVADRGCSHPDATPHQSPRWPGLPPHVG